MSSRGKGRGQYRGRGYIRGRFRGRGRSGYGRGYSHAWNHHSAHAPYVSVPFSTTAMPIHPMATQGLYGHTGFPPMSMHHFGMHALHVRPPQQVGVRSQGSIGRAPLYPVGVRGARYHGQGSWAGECGSPGSLGKGELGSWSERAHNLIAQETAISIQCRAATQ